MPVEKIRFRGNPRHLAQLTEAVENGDISRWNAIVRKGGPSFRPRLAGADLSGLSLREARLDNADLSDANLSGAVLARAALTGARLRGANLAGADLTGARLLRADFSNADLSGANLGGVKARGAVFIGADLSGTKLDGADLADAALKGAAITGASRPGAKLKVRVKVKSDAAPEPAGGTAPESEGAYSPWIMAMDEEARLKVLRESREKEEAEAERKRLDRKLGRKKPLFKRVK